VSARQVTKDRLVKIRSLCHVTSIPAAMEALASAKQTLMSAHAHKDSRDCVVKSRNQVCADIFLF